MICSVSTMYTLAISVGPIKNKRLFVSRHSINDDNIYPKRYSFKRMHLFPRTPEQWAWPVSMGTSTATTHSATVLSATRCVLRYGRFN